MGVFLSPIGAHLFFLSTDSEDIFLSPDNGNHIGANISLDPSYISSFRGVFSHELVIMFQAATLGPASTSDSSRPRAVHLIHITKEPTKWKNANLALFQPTDDVFYHIAIRVLKARIKRDTEGKGKRRGVREKQGVKTKGLPIRKNAS